MSHSICILCKQPIAHKKTVEWRDGGWIHYRGCPDHMRHCSATPGTPTYTAHVAMHRESILQNLTTCMDEGFTPEFTAPAKNNVEKLLPGIRKLVRKWST
jgi:hypothetical protein